ncbi:MAG: protein phosphatase 2C domain-containing protein [Bacillota bacterium]|nr:protein phosphatase 2C domain-containing protein [Bacillota bacterium]
MNADCFLNGSYVPDLFDLESSGHDNFDSKLTTTDRRTVCLAVFSGKGDASSVESASWMAAKALKSEISRLALLDLPLIDSLMQRYTNHISERIREVLQTDNSMNETGTTFACLCLRGNQAAAYKLGDCRAYLCRQSQLMLMTKESINKTKKDAASSSDYLGMPSNVKPLSCNASGIYTLQDQDCFLLCSESLTDHIDDPTIRSCLNFENPQHAAAQLMSHACAHGCQRNITFTVVRWSEKEPLQQTRVVDAGGLSYQQTPNPRIEHEHKVFQIAAEKHKIKPEAFKLSHINFWQNIPFWLQVLNLIALLGIILFLIWLIWG